MANTITLVCNIIFLVFISFGALWGLIRGFRKTLSRGLFLLLIGIITLFITIPITKLLLEIPITFEIDNASGEVSSQSMTLIEFTTTLIERFLGEDISTKYPNLAEEVVSLPLMLINAIAYLVIFWVLKILLMPVNVLFTKLFFEKKKRTEKVLAFASNNQEYPNSDQSIKPLNDIYVASQAEDNNNQGMFIKKETEIGKDAPTAEANRPNITPIIKPATPIAPPPSKKELKKQAKADKKANKPKKQRLLGAAVGLCVGVVVMFNTLIPIYGILNIVSSHNSTEFTNITDEKISLSKITNGITNDIVKGYELSVLGRVSRMIGVEQLGLLAFDKVTTTKIANKNASLRSDINAIMKTATEIDNVLGQYKDINEKGLKNISQIELDSLINGASNIISQAENIQIVNALSSYIVPLSVEYILQNDLQLNEDPVINELILDILVHLADENKVQLFNEMKAVIDTAQYLNEQKLLIKIVKNDYSDMLTTVQTLDDDFAEKLCSKLFTIETINSTAPSLLNLGLTIFAQVSNFEYSENDSVTAEKLKLAMTSLLDSALDTAKTISSESAIYVTDESLMPIGRLLNTFQNSEIFNETTYEKLLDFATQRIKEVTNSVIPENFINFFNNHLLKNIYNVTDWESEMQTIATSLQILRDKTTGILGTPTDTSELREGFSLKFRLQEDVLINIGKALDNLEQSILFGSEVSLDTEDDTYGNTTTISLFTSLFTELNSRMFENNDSMLGKLSDIVTLMKDNLITSRHLIVSGEESKFWEDEMKAVSPLVIAIYDITKSDEFNIPDTLGEHLDESRKSTILKGSSTLKLMSKVIEIVQDQILGSDYQVQNDESIEDEIFKLMSAIKTNLDSDTFYNDTMKDDTEFWQTEIPQIISLKNIADKANSISSIGSAQEIAEDLDHVYTSRIIPDTAMNSTIACVLTQIKNSNAEEQTIQYAINDLIDEIAEDIKDEEFSPYKQNPKFWQEEFGYINEITNIDFEGSNIIDELGNIGTTLDNIVNIHNVPDAKSSYFITELRIRKVLATAIHEIKDNIIINASINETLGDVISDIGNNFYKADNEESLPYITSFNFELINIQNLANIQINDNLFAYGTENQLSLLQSLGAELDAIAFNLKTETISEENIISYNDYSTQQESSINESDSNEDSPRLNSNIITRTSINSIISACFNMAKGESSEGESSEGESSEDDTSLIKTIISSIQTSINEISTTDKVITWSRELSYIPTLLELSQNTTYTIDNIIDNVSTHIDHIAFNSIDINQSEENPNYTFADVQYNAENKIIGAYYYINNGTHYNSVIVSRAILKNAVDSILEDLYSKETDTAAEITNEVINKLKTTINTTDSYNTEFYNNYSKAFEDLTYIKNEINKYKNISSLSIDTGNEIDKMLDELENKILSGVKTTRKIAMLILDKLSGLSQLTYYQTLKNSFEKNANENPTKTENYLDNKPFATLANGGTTPTDTQSE